MEFSIRSIGRCWEKEGILIEKYFIQRAVLLRNCRDGAERAAIGISDGSAGIGEN